MYSLRSKSFFVAQIFVALVAGGSARDLLPASTIGGKRGTHISRDLKQVVANEIDQRLIGKTAADEPIFFTRNDDRRKYVRNVSDILAGVDLTAISVWNNEPGGINYQKTCTLVAPDVAIGANHFYPPNGAQVRFVDKKKKVVNLTVGSSQQVGITDIRVIRFTTSAPPTIKPAKIPLQDTELHLGPGLYLDRNFCVHVGDLNVQTSQVFMSLPNESNRAPFWTAAVTGDSSHPIFVLVDGQFALVSILHASTSGDNLRQNLPTINATMTLLGSVYKLTPLAVGTRSVGISNRDLTH